MASPEGIKTHRWQMSVWHLKPSVNPLQCFRCFRLVPVWGRWMWDWFVSEAQAMFGVTGLSAETLSVKSNLSNCRHRRIKKRERCGSSFFFFSCSDLWRLLQESKFYTVRSTSEENRSMQGGVKQRKLVVAECCKTATGNNKNHRRLSNSWIKIEFSVL